MRWDIFCKVVDNYGDVGVSWRLARQIAAEHGADVRLWVDDLESLERLCAMVDASLASQTVAGVEVSNVHALAPARPRRLFDRVSRRTGRGSAHRPGGITHHRSAALDRG